MCSDHRLAFMAELILIPDSSFQIIPATRMGFMSLLSPCTHDYNLSKLQCLSVPSNVLWSMSYLSNRIMDGSLHKRVCWSSSTKGVVILTTLLLNVIFLKLVIDKIKCGLQTLISVCAHLLRLLICSFEEQIPYVHSVLSPLNRRAIMFVL